jgi:hypothetical protein
VRELAYLFGWWRRSSLSRPTNSPSWCRPEIRRALRRWQTLPAGLALAMPNPEFEGVARQIRASLVRAGGEALAEQVYGEKVKDGETMLTRIHHRQEEIGNPIGHVDIPPEVNTLANYSAAMVAGARHPQAAASGVARFRPVGVERPPAKVHPVGAERPPAKVAPRRKHVHYE